ncbi:grasp-with-spasm system SPASM domain peptide maturase [Fluviicola sp.]|jgi:SPASM domain peptide maturase of grasp-with-spasm system|uniref:grasp-with-spasm system SPASM domain peptide maturase n=1 Tax=Fluviicola sp. TaxID=1917219 RepID=UPI002828A6CA|nr:grasp-with-spasm system SPASM domain peptide maturase [Fluviicola sp.]MDR0803254.1 grasp-with-spasm system SPASM domain peptide maturase [Fluviicola sp.]
MKVNKSYLMLYPNIIPVQGFNRSVLMDLYIGNYLFIPNYLCDFLLKNKNEKLRKSDFLNLAQSDEDKHKITELLNYLIEQDYLTEADWELAKGLSVKEPKKTEDSLITDCIMELSHVSDWQINRFLSEINRIGVKFLEIRFLDFPTFEKHLNTIQSALHYHSVEFVHLLVPFNNNLADWINTSLSEFTRLNQLTIYNTNYTFDAGVCPFQITFLNQKSIDQTQCGCISPYHFNFNIISYYDSQKVNSCLANKLSIDQYGNIRNCPSKKDSFGKLEELDIEQTVQLRTFQQEWHITKESILVCSDCEFRWMCSDCRVFIQDENVYSKPSKCGYNPYISKWINESGYVTESECGVSVENGRLFIDEDRLNQINEQLWN